MAGADERPALRHVRLTAVRDGGPCDDGRRDEHGRLRSEPHYLSPKPDEPALHRAARVGDNVDHRRRHRHPPRHDHPRAVVPVEAPHRRRRALGRRPLPRVVLWARAVARHGARRAVRPRRLEQADRLRDVARELGLEGADKLTRNLFEAMNVWDEEHGLAATPALCGPPPSVPSTSVFISP
jgi:hypothetical protein